MATICHQLKPTETIGVMIKPQLCPCQMLVSVIITNPPSGEMWLYEIGEEPQLIGYLGTLDKWKSGW